MYFRLLSVTAESREYFPEKGCPGSWVLASYQDFHTYTEQPHLML